MPLLLAGAGLFVTSWFSDLWVAAGGRCGAGEPRARLARFVWGAYLGQFTFKGAVFTYADSGDAAIDPLVEEWIEGWMAKAIDRTHVVLTHMPPIDPVGTRAAAFRSTRDGYRLLSRLVEGRVDLTLYGHIHTHVACENAGIRRTSRTGEGPNRCAGTESAVTSS